MARSAICPLDSEAVKTNGEVKVRDWLLPDLRCPRCRGLLRLESPTSFACVGSCGMHYPVLDGVPILINEDNSLCRVSDFLSGRTTFFRRRSRLARLVDRLIPSPVLNVGSAENFRAFTRAVRDHAEHPKVLVIGGSVLGVGMEPLVSDRAIRLVETDISLGPRTQLVVDAHDIPFADGTFHGAVAQATLEHVLDPVRCVEEVRRVLVSGGLLYVEIPFLQPVHGGRYDFTRFSHAGVRWVLNGFEELRSGAVCGPGSAASYSLSYLLKSFGRSHVSRAVLYRLGLVLTFWLKYLDLLLVGNVAALDAASSIYFLGRKTEQRLSRRAVVERYRGGHR